MSEQSHTLIETLGKDYKFAPDFEDGIVFDYRQFKDDKHTTRLRVVAPTDRPREATLNIFAYTMSLGAVHHYAKFSLGHPSYVHASNGKRWGYGVSGYGSEIPFGAKTVSFELMRLVDKRDFKHDKFMAKHGGHLTYLYGRMKRGDYTHGFWSEEEAIQAATVFFKKHFAPGWILVPDAWSSDERPEYART